MLHHISVGQTRVSETFWLREVNSATIKATRYVLMLTLVLSNSSCMRPLGSRLVCALNIQHERSIRNEYVKLQIITDLGDAGTEVFTSSRQRVIRLIRKSSITG